MYDNEIGKTLSVTIRLEDTAGADVTGKVNANLTVKKSDKADTALVTVVEGDRSLNELGEGDYTLHIDASVIDTLGFFRVKVLCSGCVTKQYVVDVIPTKLDVYFKSTGDDSLGDGSFGNPYKTLGQCLTHIASRPGFSIHVLDNPADVAGNQDQVISIKGLKVFGHGFSWSGVTPTTYHLGCSTIAKNIELFDLVTIKLQFDPDAENITCKHCTGVTLPSATSVFPKYSLFEDVQISAAVTGTGNFGKGTTFRNVRFVGNVTVGGSWTGGAIMENCVIEGNFDIGLNERIQLINLSVTGTFTAGNNGAFQGQTVFRNVSIEGAATIDGKKYVFIGGLIRGALNLSSNSVDCLFWNTRVKGAITDTGSGNEVLNESECALEASVQAVKAKTDNLPAGPASEGNVSAVGAAVTALAAIAALDATVAKEATALTLAKYIDFFNKEVLTRDGEEPATYKLGTGGGAKTIDVDHVVIGSKKKADKETVL